MKRRNLLAGAVMALGLATGAVAEDKVKVGFVDFQTISRRGLCQMQNLS